MKKAVFLFLFPFLCYGKIIGNPKSGEFLTINFNARSIACGGAGAGMADGISSLYLNPSSIIGIRDEEAIFFHSEWIDDLQYEFVGYGREMRGSAISLSASWLHMPQIKGRGPNREPLDYSASDLSLIFSYAKKTRKGVLGGSVKSILEKIEEENGKGIAIDLGWLWRRSDFGVGVSLLNLGPDIHFKSQSNPLPFLIRVGFFWQDPRWKGFFDVVKESKEPFSLHLGGEYPLKGHPLSLRAGAYTDMKRRNGVSCGFEIEHNVLSLEYAYFAYEKDLENTHHISLKINF